MNHLLRYFLAACLLIAACQDDGARTGRPKLNIEEDVVDDRRDERGRGVVVVQVGDGQGIYFFYGRSQPSDPFPFTIDGELVHTQRHVIELPDGHTEERWVIVTRGNDSTTVTLYGPEDPDNPLRHAELASQKHKGAFSRSIVNEADDEKTFLFGEDGWLVMSLVDGSEIRSSNEAAPPNVQSIEFVNGFVVIIESWNNETEIRFRTFALNGTLVATVVMPGNYIASTTDRRDIKAVVTRHNGTIFQDLVQISTGTLVTQQAGNGMNGDHVHLQFDSVGGGRFIEIVYNPGRDDTEVRIIDTAGTILATHILPGRFRQALAAGSAPNQSKVIVTEKHTRAAATVIDLTSGRLGSTTQAGGQFQRILSGPGGVTLGAGGITLPVTIP